MFDYYAIGITTNQKLISTRRIVKQSSLTAPCSGEWNHISSLDFMIFETA